MSQITASQARQTLPSQLDRVEAGEEVEITRHGRVVAVLVNPERLAARRAPELSRTADRIGQLLDSARQNPLRQTLSRDRADELIADIRAGRQGR